MERHTFSSTMYEGSFFYRLHRMLLEGKAEDLRRDLSVKQPWPVTSDLSLGRTIAVAGGRLGDSHNWTHRMNVLHHRHSDPKTHVSTSIESNSFRIGALDSLACSIDPLATDPLATAGSTT